jgi:hypothetical protein
MELGTSCSRLKFVDMATVLDSPRNCCSCFKLHLGKGGLSKLAVPRLERPRSCGNAVAARTWTQLRGRGSVACPGQFWTIAKAPNTGLFLADTRSTGRFTSALFSFLHGGVGLDTKIVHEGRYVVDKCIKLKVKYWNKLYRRRWEDKVVLRKGCVETQTRVFWYRVRSSDKLFPSLQ